MADKRKRKMMENLDRCYKVVQQSRTGINAVDIAKKLNVHRTTAHSYLNSLELMGKVYSQHGLWYPKEPSNEQKSSKNSLFLKRVFQQIDEIKEIMFTADHPSEAFGRMRFLIAQLPPPLKDKMQIAERKTLEILKNIPHNDFQRYQSACYNYTRALLDKLSTLLYEENI